jgi:hypothetical protein
VLADRVAAGEWPAGAPCALPDAPGTRRADVARVTVATTALPRRDEGWRLDRFGDMRLLE